MPSFCVRSSFISRSPELRPVRSFKFRPHTENLRFYALSWRAFLQISNKVKKTIFYLVISFISSYKWVKYATKYTNLSVFVYGNFAMCLNALYDAPLVRSTSWRKVERSFKQKFWIQNWEQIWRNAIHTNLSQFYCREKKAHRKVNLHSQFSSRDELNEDIITAVKHNLEKNDDL